MICSQTKDHTTCAPDNPDQHNVRFLKTIT
jgi:hypothetical protein